MTPVTIVFDAALPVQVIVVALIVAAVAAVVVTVKKIASGPHLSGGSAYLSALRLGAPLLGLLGAAFNGLMMFVALAKFGPQPINVLAPGLAEATFLVVMGLIVGVVAVICHWAVEARVDRAVLRA
ncbi:MotA/TolQ/ExbB proton channel family protein [Brevundimonas sp.]|uniref:MotA/TolQ/ExbB proton channel family protein n=1 Tax=Brevundimonas sp. TaxID=1871086 RepID=UPI00286D3D29|nr:MotA/TolQ/ExbB proton channel family protein [Brevundimonas sp.]